MKRLLFFIIVISLLFDISQAQEFEIWAEFSGAAVWDDGGTDKLRPNQRFDIELWAENNSTTPQLGWSSPFRFTGTDSITEVSFQEFVVSDDFLSIWTMFYDTFGESWDGQLPDQFNISGIGMDGFEPGMGPMLIGTFTFMAPNTGGMFCIDSGNFALDIYDWLFDPPAPDFEKVCLQVDQLACCPPEITNCVSADVNAPHGTDIILDFDAIDPESDPITFSLVSGPGVINPTTGVWTWTPGCADVGSHTVEIGVSDPYLPGETCAFSVIVTNSAPQISGSCGQSFSVSTNASRSVQFYATDENEGDTQTWSVSASPEPGGSYGISSGLLTFTPSSLDDGMTFTFSVGVWDCAGFSDLCDVEINIGCCLEFDLVIEKVHDQLQGHHSYVGVKKMTGNDEMRGFDFLIGYDQSVLTFTGAVSGEPFDEPGMYEWEYFTYRYSWNGNCGNGCPGGLLRVVGMAEQNDGGNHPLSYLLADGTELFYLDFLVSNDRTFECMFVPVYFYWMDCGDNTVAYRELTDPTGLHILTAVSRFIYHYNGDMSANPPGYYEYHDGNAGYPTAYGNQDFCLENSGPGKPTPMPLLNYFNGGVDIVCADAIDARGDVNLNGVANEIADAVVLTNYFVYGLSAFTVNVEGQIAATEINGDGIPLSVADLVYLIRIIVGDALPIPKVAPNLPTDIIVTGNSISINAEIGAAHFVLEGNAEVGPGPGAARMELKSYFNGSETNVIIYSFDKGSTASGEILITNGTLLKANLADYDGNTFDINILPTDFVLKQNYPNPFNPRTTIEMFLPVASDFNLVVFNVNGQKVFEEKGFGEAGPIRFEIDLSSQASGIYFYKVTAGEYSATKKMILLK